MELHHVERQSLHQGSANARVEVFIREPNNGVNEKRAQVFNDKHSSPRNLGAKVLDINDSTVTGDAIGHQRLRLVKGNMLFGLVIDNSDSQSVYRAIVAIGKVRHHLLHTSFRGLGERHRLEASRPRFNFNVNHKVNKGCRN